MASALAAQPDDMSSVSGTHSVEGNSQLPRDSHMCAMVCTPTLRPHTKINHSIKIRGVVRKLHPPS